MRSGTLKKLEGRESVFQWRLEKLSSLNDESYYSPIFDFQGQSWCLSLYSNGSKQNVPEGYMRLCLSLDWEEPGIEVGYSLVIRVGEFGKAIRRTGTKNFGSDGFEFCTDFDRSELLQSYWEFMEDLTMMEYQCSIPMRRPQENLTITVTLRVLEAASKRDASLQTAVEESVTGGGKGERSEKTAYERVGEDIGKLWPDGENTDVLLRVGGVEFKAHKTILSARTPVLGAMFQHDTVEKTSGEANIDDCKPEVFEQLLYYAYKGAPRELNAKNASALYVVADKYLVSEVKTLCVRCMRDTLCLDTFCDILTLSLLHREDELLNTATNFMSENMIGVMKTVQWQRFLREHPTWSNEIQIRAMELIEDRHEKEKRTFLHQSTC